MHKLGFSHLVSVLTETFGFGRLAAVAAVSTVALITLVAGFWFFDSAPPRTLTITSGPPDSVFEVNAGKYRDILAKKGVTLKVLPSQGSLDNLKRLADPTAPVDVGFVQGGMTNNISIDKLFSLGSLSYQPLLVFCRAPGNPGSPGGPEKPGHAASAPAPARAGDSAPAGASVPPATASSGEPGGAADSASGGAAAAPGGRIVLLSQLAGKRVAIGPLGSGAHALALTLLESNGIKPGGSTTLLEISADDAAAALLAGQIDAVFMMSDAASPEVMKKLVHSPGVELFNFSQADGYTRKIQYLDKLVLPRGAIDFGKDIPPQDIYLVGPTVELVARDNLHPALSDLLLEAAQEVHGKASMFQRRGEFPAPLEHEFRISPDAERYYKSGKTFLYRSLPFWLASLVSRTAVLVVPLIVLIPGLRVIPVAYKWRTRLKIYRWYRALMGLERDHAANRAEQRAGELLERLNQIEAAVKAMKVPMAFADQVYALRGYINFVRTRLTEMTPR